MASKFLYRYVFKRTSTFVLGVVISSMLFERAYDSATESVFQWINKGRFWEDIKDRYSDQPQEVRYQRRSVPVAKTTTTKESSQKLNKTADRTN
ncbi:cytochrome b-c1 complex subunit 9-like [Halictus rubicundus]|uniref:cytochrome b-c1 complex subunit 9-like n=1 Tax=Halictus rubicundus TaxID=77578 RepID=UPI004035CC55